MKKQKNKKNRQKQEQLDHLRELIKKAKEEENRVNTFKQRKRQRAMQRGARKSIMIEKSLTMYKKKTEEQMQKTKLKNAKAEEHRLALIAQRKKEQQIHELMKKLKRETALKQVQRKSRMQEFRTQELKEKMKVEEQKRVKALKLQELLNRKRITATNMTHARQLELQEQLEKARRDQDIDRMKKLIKELESPSRAVSPNSRKLLLQQLEFVKTRALDDTPDPKIELIKIKEKEIKSKIIRAQSGRPYY